jgi:uncharacterized SAM-binding protein YcdF (DUF218 family)
VDAHKTLFTRKRFLLLILGSGILGIVLLLAAVAFPQYSLRVDDGDVSGDILIVLGGGSYERPTRAAELFRAGAANRILVTGAGDCESNRQLLVRAGVTADRIITESRARTTRENALLTIPLLRKLGVRKAVLVTSWYHSRRALKCFRHYAPEIQFYSRPAYFAFARPEWKRHGIYRYIRAEFAKLAGYWVCYGVCPL